MSRSEQPSVENGSVLTLDSGLEALRASDSFNGPVEPLDGHEANEHLAQIYESRDEQVAATVPYLVQGLRRDERCMCVLEDRSRDAVVEELRAADVDVDAALASGALTFHTVDETYLRDGEFDGDEMISFYADVIDETTREFSALRVVAEATFLLDRSASLAEFMRYESKINDLFHDEDCIALCQYDRRRFPPAILQEVIQTHPHLVYDNTVCHNFYYTPPEEFFNPDQPGREIDRMMRTLVERTKAKVELQESEEYLRRQNEVMGRPDWSFEEKLQALMELGCERFGLDVGFLSHADGETLEILEAAGDHELIQPGAKAPLSETYCREVLGADSTLDVENAGERGWEDTIAYERYGLESLLGTTINVGHEPYGTLCFASTAARDRPFSDDERTFLELASKWVSYELEREHREAQLAALNEMARDLMNGNDEGAIADAVVEHAADTLALPVSAVVTLDRETGSLTTVAETDRAVDALPTTALCDRDGGAFWEAFVATEVRTIADLSDLSGVGDDLTEIVAVPLGTHGLFVTATTDSGGFCKAERDFVEATAATVEAATLRADRERKLKQREQTLEAQNESLGRLRRINDIIRRIDQGLVQASSRSEIEAVVCEQLATVGPYDLAWIGDHDVVADEVTPRESAGAETGYVDRLVADASDALADPTVTALETREPQVVNDVLTDDRCEGCRQAALTRGYHAAIALPLIYEDKLYGVLTVYAGQPGVFDDLERSVLAEMSDTIAYAINAVESKQSLASDERTVLEFDVEDAGLPLLTIGREADCTVSLDSVVHRADGALHGYFTTVGADPDDVLVLQSSLPVTELRLITQRDDGGEPRCHFEGALSDDSLAATVLEHGSRLTEAYVVDGTATVAVEIAADANVREFVDMFQTRYPDSTLVAQRSEATESRTPAEFHATLTDELTPRQLEAIQTAFYNGFFERPRPRTGKEIAEAMDITQPTFNGHLRAAQRKLCERLFEGNVLPDRN